MPMAHLPFGPLVDGKEAIGRFSPLGCGSHPMAQTFLFPASVHFRGQCSAPPRSLTLFSLQISDRLRRSWPPSFLSEFRALQFSLMLCAFVGALGGAAFLGTAMFIEDDRRRAQLHVQGE